MFLADKYSLLLPLHPKAHRKGNKASAAAGPTARFDSALAARLRDLLPLPSTSPLATVARLAGLVALTLGDAAPALLATAEGDDAAAAVAAHLDAGVALLDACNAITARLEGLRRRRLLARLALHLLASSSTVRARAALADRDGSPPPPPLPSVPFINLPPHGRLSDAARVLVAVNAVSSLAAATAAAVLGGGVPATTAFPLIVSNDFSWADAFNAVSTQLSAANNAAGEVDAIDEAVRKLSSVLDGATGDEAALRAAAREVEMRTEEVTARLDRVADAVNGVFRAALCLRNAELGSFTVGPAEKTTCK